MQPPHLKWYWFLCFPRLTLSKEHTLQNIDINVQPHPVHDFLENHRLLACAFPFLFPFGLDPEHFSKPLHVKTLRRLFLFSDGRFDRNQQLCFVLFDTLQRYKASLSVSLRLKREDGIAERFIDLVQNPRFLQRLENAIENPKSKDHHELIKTLIPLLRSTANKVPFSSGEREESLSHLHSQTIRLGFPDAFVTISPFVANSPIALRLAALPNQLHDDRCTCPRVHTPQDSESHINPQVRTEWFKDTPFHDVQKRAELMACRPAAAAEYFHFLETTVMEEVVKCDRSVGRRKTRLQSDTKGIFGHCRGEYGVVEQQTRGALHVHAVAWTDSFCRMFPSVSATEEGRTFISSVVDSMFTASYDTEYLQQIDEEKRMQDKQAAGSYIASLFLKDPPLTVDQIGNDSTDLNSRVNYHARHSATCLKHTSKNYDHTKCRLGVPRHVSETSGLTDISYSYGTGTSEDGKPVKELIETKHIDVRHTKTRLDLTHPLPDKTYMQIECPDEHHVLVVDIKRKEGRDQRQIEANDLLTCVTRCNTCVECLGTLQQAVNTMFYLAKYLSKTDSLLSASLNVFKAALIDSFVYRSLSQENTKQRDAKYVLSKVVNRVSTSSEYSDQAVITALLGYPSNPKSDDFNYCHIHEACRYVEMRKDELNSDKPKPTSIGTEDVSAKQTSTVILPIEKKKSTTRKNEKVQRETKSVTEGSMNEERKEPPEHSSSTQLEKQTISENSPTDIHVVLSSPHVDYAYRGTELQSLSLYEWIGMVAVGKDEDSPSTSSENMTAIETGKVPLVPTKKTHSGRHKSAHFHFHPSHPAPGNRIQHLRSKQVIPLLSGVPPPPPPKLNDEGIPISPTAANIFAKFAATLFLPWSHENLPPTDWKQFSIQTGPWKADTASFIQSRRLLLIQRIALLNHTPKIEKDLLTEYRYEHAFLRGDAERKDDPARTDVLSFDPSAPSDTNAVDADNVLAVMNNTGIETNGGGDIIENEYLSNLEHSILDLHLAAETLNQFIPSPPNSDAAKTAALEAFTPNSADATFTKIKAIAYDRNLVQQTPEDTLTDAISPSGRGSLGSTGPDTLSPFTNSLNTEQKKAFTVFTDMISSGSQPLLLCTGPPGCGKTYLSAKIQQFAESKGLRTTFCAPTAVAAKLGAGYTIHKLLKIRPYDSHGPSSEQKELKPESKVEIYQYLGISDQQFPHECASKILLIVDEISMVGMRLFNDIDRHLRSLFDSTLPLGGIAMIALGDMMQLPSLDYPTLPEAMIKSLTHSNPETLINSVNAFSLFRRFILSGQMRVDISDKAHIHLINKIRDLSVPNPLSLPRILKYRKLTIEDIVDENWAFAPIVVARNTQRHSINRKQMVNFSRRYKVPLYHWHVSIHIGDKLTIPNPTGNNKKGYSTAADSFVISKLAQNNGEIDCYFAFGAPVVLESNINVEACVVNGSRGTLHSLTLPEEYQMPSVPLHYRYGDTIELPCQPYSVNVDIEVPERVHPSRLLRVPLLASKTKLEVKKKNFKAFIHSFSPAFAITYHKIQGATLDRIILLIHKYPSRMNLIQLPHLYVGLSRVRNSANIKILPIGSKTDLNYIDKLQYKPVLRKWNKCYDENGMWNPKVLSNIILNKRKTAFKHLKALSDIQLERSTNKVLLSFFEDLDIKKPKQKNRAHYIPILKSVRDGHDISQPPIDLPSRTQSLLSQSSLSSLSISSPPQLAPPSPSTQSNTYTSTPSTFEPSSLN